MSDIRLGSLLIALVIALTGCKSGAGSKTDDAPSEETSDKKAPDAPFFKTLYRGEGPAADAVDGCHTDFESKQLTTTCGDLYLTMSRKVFAPEEWDEAAVDRFVQVAQQGSKMVGGKNPPQIRGGQKIEEGRIPIWYVRRVSTTTQGDQIDGYMGMVDGAKGMRLFFCGSQADQLPDQTKCYDKVESLVTVVDTYLESQSAEVVGLEVYGEPVEFEPGCELSRGSVTCDEAIFSWEKDRAPSYYGSKLQRKGLTTYLKNLGSSRVEMVEMSCEIPHAPVECYSISSQVDGPQPYSLFMLVAQATDQDGEPWALGCVVFGTEDTATLPHPCSEVFTKVKPKEASATAR